MPLSVRKFSKGFTLLEMLVVILIVGVLASVAAPSYVNHVERVRSSEGAQLLTAILASQESFRIENNAYATAIASLDIDVNPANFAAPTLFNAAARVATLLRSDGTYTLCINSTGVISCSGAASICGGYAAGGAGICP